MASQPQSVSPSATVSAAPTTAAVAAAQRRSWLSRRTLLSIAALVILVGGTYAFAWYKASSLTSTYLHDADTSYDGGKYLDALVGSEEFDTASNRYVTRGGYLQVEKIWSDPHAQPVPAGVERARGRIDEIINHRLTIDQAENFIQANTGKNNPYFGVIYLRLGELYEQEGSISDAREVYSTIPDAFRDEPDLVAQAQAHLSRLPAK